MKNENNWHHNTCIKCPDLVSCRSQIVLASPPPKSYGLLAIGEAPGQEEDKKGEGFVGIAGKTLDRLLAPHGILREDYGRANICRCRPLDNRKPTKEEINSCLDFLADLIIEVKPKVILTVGSTATAVLCGKGSLSGIIQDRVLHHNWTVQFRIERAHLKIQEALQYVSYIVPMPHTSPLAFNRNAPSGEKWAAVAARQILTAVNLLNL